MKIEKIKNYNQRVLAILGTLAVIFGIVGLIAFIALTISDYRRYDYDDDTGILSEEKIEELQKENKREQVVSYLAPRLVDTLNSIHIIPVTHKTLNEPEDIGGTLNAFVSSEKIKKSDNRYSKRIYGAFNNVVVYDQKKDETIKLFDSRVNFQDIDVEYFSDDIILLFEVAEKDTFKDGVINLLDFKSLYIYSLSEKKLKRIGDNTMNMFNYKFLNESKDLIIQYGVDKNNNGKYEDHNEPITIKKYNYKTKKLTDIISSNLNSKLQMLLEGSKKE